MKHEGESTYLNLPSILVTNAARWSLTLRKMCMCWRISSQVFAAAELSEDEAELQFNLTSLSMVFQSYRDGAYL